MSVETASTGNSRGGSSDSGRASVGIVGAGSSSTESASTGRGACTSDADCATSGALGTCDPARGICVECLAEMGTCGDGRYCGSDSQCHAGCSKNSDCASGACDILTNQCIACSSDAECHDAETCIIATGACVENCLATGACSSSCKAGWADCDESPVNGCETDLATSVTNCGSCGAICAASHGSTRCVAGQCAPSCYTGFGECDGIVTNGCETNIQTDVKNCGYCGTVCSLPHATTNCIAGSCRILSCNEGWADCNGIAADGCESNLLTNLAHCGACNAACNPAHGSGTCVQGRCTIASCQGKYQDCNRVAGDGCESNLQSSVNDCGGCGVVCNQGHGTASCDGGTCKINCESGFGNCDGTLENGCETAIASDAKHCGECGRACDGECVAAACVTTPCSGYCDSPVVFSIGSGTIYGIDKKVCYESYESTRTFGTGNCGQFATGHRLYINGVAVPCDISGAWDWTVPAKPAPRRGGYCFHDDKAGANGKSAWFNTW